MLIALTVGAELFGVFGAIFAAPTAGLLQALFTAIWIQYRQTHRDEFVDDEGEKLESASERSEALPPKTPPPTLTIVEENSKNT
jgi:hypothetical protein